MAREFASQATKSFKKNSSMLLCLKGMFFIFVLILTPFILNSTERHAQNLVYGFSV